MSATRRLLLALGLLLSVPLAFAAVDGAVINQTTGAPQAGAMVTLYQLGAGGRQPVKTVRSDDSGAFSVDHTVQGPHLLQTIHAGVIYNQMLQPGSATTGLRLAVYDSTAKLGAAKVTQHMVLIEPMGDILHVNESVVFHNEGNTTYNDLTNGTLRVYLPPEIEGTARVMVTGPQGVPLERSASATDRENIYQIDYAVKPGETHFDVTYVVPVSDPAVFRGKALHGGGPIRLVAPEGVTFTGENVNQIGEHPTSHAVIYDVAAEEYSFTIEGAGRLQAPEAQPSGGAGIQQINPRIYDSMPWVI
ncbi:MAG: hypothetical protein GY953_10780, partial [bacterium]|nr:hypothetical protein [bacterium]